MMKPIEDGAAAPKEDQVADLFALQSQVSDQAATAPEEKKPSGPSTKDLLVPIIRLLCAVLGKMLPPAISSEEAGALTEAYAALVDKYFPGGIALGPEIAAITITLAVFGPRYLMSEDAKKSQAAQSTAADKQATAQAA